MSEFDFVDETSTPRKYGKSDINPAMIAGGCVVLAAVVGGIVWWLIGTPAKLSLAAIDNQTVNELETLNLPLKATAEGLNQGDWVYRIASGPPGATVDLKSGLLTWEPDEEQGPGEYTVTVVAQARGGKQAQDKQSFKIVVREVNQAPDIAPIPAQSVNSGDDVRVEIKAKDIDKPAQKLSYRLKNGPTDAQIASKTGVFTWTAPETSSEQNHTVEIIVTDAPTDGAVSLATFKVRVLPPASPSLRFMAALQGGRADNSKDGWSRTTGIPHGRRSCFHVERCDIDAVGLRHPDAMAEDDAQQITDGGKMLFGEPATWAALGPGSTKRVR